MFVGRTVVDEMGELNSTGTVALRARGLFMHRWCDSVATAATATVAAAGRKSAAVGAGAGVAN